MAFLTVISEVPATSIAQARLDVDYDDRYRHIRGVIRWLEKVQCGFTGGGTTGGASMRTQLASARASGTVTCDHSAVTLDATSVTIGAVTITVATTPSGEAQIANGASADLLAANLVTAINAHSVLAKFVKATRSNAVVTVTCLVPGVIGNSIALAETNAGFVVSAAFLASGASDEIDAFEFGYAPSV